MDKKNKQIKRRLVVVSYRVPFNRDGAGSPDEQLKNTGGLVSALLSLLNGKSGTISIPVDNVLWIGCREGETDAPEQRFTVDGKLEIVTTAIPKLINKRFYNGFSNELIWPLFHYFPSLASFKKEDYLAYKKANGMVCRKIASLVQPDDYIWIHDYHFLFLPKMLRDMFPWATIGFFLHIPFPSFEIFRLLPRAWREEIIQGLLGADLIGFHTYSYAQYFLRSLKMIAGYENSLFQVFTPDRLIKLDSFPISIDFKKFNTAPQSLSVANEQKKIQRFLGSRKIIFSVDRLDYTKGIHHRLQGYELFLKHNPSWHGRVVFVCVVVPSRDNIERYQKMKSEIDETISRINGAFGSLEWTPINYQYRSLRFHELVGLYCTSDIGLVTPLRDGMNLVAKEYVASCNDGHGVLILSEMTGAAAELGEALIINPTDIHEVADAIKRGLEMSPAEQKKRLLKMQKRIRTYNIFMWANDYLNQLERIKEEQESMNIKLISTTIRREILSRYRKSKHCMFIFDYDGTLVPFTKDPTLAIPDSPVHTIMNRLLRNPANEIAVVSGRGKDELSSWFGKMKMHLIAEHGAFVKMLNKKWKQFAEFPESFKKIVLPVLTTYVNRCTGAFIEEKETSLCWHYRSADPEYSFVRSRELISELSEMISPDMNIQILDGKKVIEVKRSGCNKGTAVAHTLAESSFDFILAIGDDKTDEDMFRVVNELKGYTIKVGLEPSYAQYNLRYQSDVIALLDKFVQL